MVNLVLVLVICLALTPSVFADGPSDLIDEQGFAKFVTDNKDATLVTNMKIDDSKIKIIKDEDGSASKGLYFNTVNFTLNVGDTALYASRYVNVGDRYEVKIDWTPSGNDFFAGLYDPATGSYSGYLATNTGIDMYAIITVAGNYQPAFYNPPGLSQSQCHYYGYYKHIW